MFGTWEDDLSFKFPLMQEGASQLQSRKFLPLMYQLAARMSARTLASDPFQQTLQQVCARLCMHSCMCVRASVCVLCVCMFICVCVYVCVCVFMWMCVYVCVHVYV